jgi:putative Ca2+/H+ antiporter (TMEM165/GDT1 family)
LAEELLFSLGIIVGAMFVAELTDKDAFLILALSTRIRPSRVFLAGATAFILTSAIIVTTGALLVSIVPIVWVKYAGGGVMIAYGLWEFKGLVGERLVEKEESKLLGDKGGWRTFAAMVGALALLDLAGDATEILIVLFMAQYSDALLVFAGSCVGLVSATAFETALGNRLGRLLTPQRIRYVSIVVFLALGSSVIIFNAL